MEDRRIKIRNEWCKIAVDDTYFHHVKGSARTCTTSALRDYKETYIDDIAHKWSEAEGYTVNQLDFIRKRPMKKVDLTASYCGIVTAIFIWFAPKICADFVAAGGTMVSRCSGMSWLLHYLRGNLKIGPATNIFGQERWHTDLATTRLRQDQDKSRITRDPDTDGRAWARHDNFTIGLLMQW